MKDIDEQTPFIFEDDLSIDVVENNDGVLCACDYYYENGFTESPIINLIPLTTLTDKDYGIIGLPWNDKDSIWRAYRAGL